MEMLFQIKNPAKIDKWIGELKEKIAILKTKMQGNELGKWFYDKIGK